MNGCFSKLALSAVQVCTQSRASLHAAFFKFAQRPVQACAATLPNLRSTDSKLALGVGHGGKGGNGLSATKRKRRSWYTDAWTLRRIWFGRHGLR